MTDFPKYSVKTDSDGLSMNTVNVNSKDWICVPFYYLFIYLFCTTNITAFKIFQWS